MQVASFDSEGGFKLNQKFARQNHKWLAKIKFSATLPDGSEVIEEDSVRAKSPCKLIAFLPQVQEAVDGMLIGFDDAVASSSYCTIWKL